MDSYSQEMVGQVDEASEESSIKQHQTDQIYCLVWVTDLQLAATGTVAVSYSFGILFYFLKVCRTNSNVAWRIFMTKAGSYSYVAGSYSFTFTVQFCIK